VDWEIVDSITTVGAAVEGVQEVSNPITNRRLKANLLFWQMVIEHPYKTKMFLHIHK